MTTIEPNNRTNALHGIPLFSALSVANLSFSLFPFPFFLFPFRTDRIGQFEFYAKQTQFAECSNKRKCCYNKGLSKYPPPRTAEKQTQSNPICSPNEVFRRLLYTQDTPLCVGRAWKHLKFSLIFATIESKIVLCSNGSSYGNIQQDGRIPQRATRQDT